MRGPLFLCGVLLRLLQLTYSQSGPSCRNGDIRLQGGNTYLEGRVEVCVREEWGTVCDDEWEEPDANVACGQLGFSNQGAIRFDGPLAGETNAVRSPFGEGSGNVVLEELRCTGNESSLFECLRRSRCAHTEDAGLRCQSKGVSLVSAGQLVPNNSLLSLDAINNTVIISCTTDQQSNYSWFPPTGDDPVVEESSLSSSDNSSLLQSRGDSGEVQIVRPGGAVEVENGLYRCEIPDKDNVSQTLYVGIYSDELAGDIESVSVTYDNTSQTFICTSTGGPATFVTWMLDDSNITVDDSRYESSQLVTNTSTATYENKLKLVAKSASLSGTYTCSVGNTAGSASGSATISVCRDGEVRRMVDGTATVQICLEDKWLTLNNSLQVAMESSQVTNIQFEEENGVALSWLPPTTDEEILRYDLSCTSSSDSDARLTWSLPGDAQTSTSPLPFLLPQATYTCCVTTVTQGRMGVEFISTACQDGLVVSTPPTPTTCPSCPPVPGCSAFAETILVPVLGVLTGLFFVALLIVSCALLLFMRAATSGKRASYETNGLVEHEMKTSTLTKDSTIPRKPSDPLVANPMYGSSNTVGDNMVMSKEERRRSNASQAAPNPMYSTNQEIRRSFNVRRGERVDGVQRSHSSAAALNRRVSPRKKVEMIPPVYTTVVPKDLRKKTSSMSTQDQLPSEQQVEGATGNTENPVYSDIDQIKPRPREPTPEQDSEEMGYRGREPSPLHQSEQGGGAIYSDINPVNGAIPNQLTPPVSRPGAPPTSNTGDQMELRGKEPSPNPEQVAAEEADGAQAPLYAALDMNEVETVSTAPVQPRQSEGEDGVTEPLYSSIHDPVTPPPRSKTLSVSHTRGKSGVGGDEGGQQDNVPAEDEYSTLKHL